MGKGNVRTRPFIYTAEAQIHFIAHHKNPFSNSYIYSYTIFHPRLAITATLSSTPRPAITRCTIFHPSTTNYPLHTFHPSATNNPLHYLLFSTTRLRNTTCVTSTQSLLPHLHCLKEL